MSLLKQFYNLLLLENILGIYRNYCNEDKTKKCCILFQIFIQTMVHFIIVAWQIYFLFIEDQPNYIYCDFLISAFGTTLLTVVTGISNSQAFASYNQSIIRVYRWFEKDKKYSNALKKIYWFSLVFIVLGLAFAILRTLDIVLNFKSKDYYTFELLIVPILISQSLLRFTVVFEKNVLFVLIMIVVNLSKCLHSLISSEMVESCNINSDEQHEITREQIQEWVELYRDLANSCNKVSLCFGRQFYFSLIMSVSYYILLTYQMFYMSFYVKVQDQKILIAIAYYVLLTTLPIVSGQLIHNQGVKFHQLVARLYNKMAVFEEKQAEAKLIKDFIRLIKKNPLEIKLLSNISTGTYLLPVILMSTVNYIIVMLQFSNIV